MKSYPQFFPSFFVNNEIFANVFIYFFAMFFVFVNISFLCILCYNIIIFFYNCQVLFFLLKCYIILVQVKVNIISFFAFFVKSCFFLKICFDFSTRPQLQTYKHLSRTFVTTHNLCHNLCHDYNYRPPFTDQQFCHDNHKQKICNKSPLPRPLQF